MLSFRKKWSEMQKQRILLTGGTGLLGSHFLKNYHDRFDITVLTRNKNYKITRNEKVISCDLSRPWSGDEIQGKFDVMMILAQERNYKNFPENSHNIFMVNVYATHKLLEYAQKNEVAKVIYASTGGIYKEQLSALKENSAIRDTFDLSFYFSTKIAGEGLAAAYKNEFNVTIIRPFFVYGENQNANTLFPGLKRKIQRGEQIILNGENGIKINPIYVADAALALNILVNNDENFVINIAGNEIISIKELSIEIARILKRKPMFIHDEEKTDIVADNSKLRSILPQDSWTSLTEGIQKCLTAL